MSFAVRYTHFIKRFLPGPFLMALGLTLVALLGSWAIAPNHGILPHIKNWNTGFWELLGFTMQMMLILVLGHTLALAPPIKAGIQKLVFQIKTHTQALFVVAILAVIAGYLNWGLALVFGSLLCLEIKNHAAENQLKINFPLLCASAYTCMMVWHGGFSGSAPLAIAKTDHSLYSEIGVVSIADTLGSSNNIFVFIMCLIILPFVAWTMRNWETEIPPKSRTEKLSIANRKQLNGVENWEYHKFPLLVISALMLIAIFLNFIDSNQWYEAIHLNSVNFILLFLCVLLHKNIYQLQQAVGQAIKSAAGILWLFPFYAGIMGIMKYGGLLHWITEGFIQLATPTTFPLFAVISSGIVNIMVPSGGGQWQVQGPVLIAAAKELGYPTYKTVLALCYGDQLTNMLQPFWALPLLGLTGLNVSQIVKYSLVFLLAGLIIFLLGLYCF